MKKLLLYMILFLLQTSTQAQPATDSELKQRLVGKTRLQDIVQTVDAYYKDPATLVRKTEKQVNSEMKRWNRWRYYWESRLSANGSFVNTSAKMLEATGLQRNGGRQGRIESVAGTWALTGPTNTDKGIGRADRLAFHPTDPNTIYAGTTAGGLWRTTTGGSSWTNLTPDIPSAGISGIVVNQQNPNIIYILTGDGDSDFGGLVEAYGYMRYSIGVLKSTDAGANWRKTADFPGVDSFLTGFALTADPNNQNVLLAATSQGLFKSSDGGDSWQMRTTTLVYDVAFRPGSSDTCYATDVYNNRSRLIRSIDGGDFFSAVPGTINSLIDSASRCKLGMAPSNSSVVYVLAGGPVLIGDSAVAGTFTGLFRSANNGATFTLQSNTPNITSSPDTGTRDLAPYNWSFAVRPTSSARLVTGAVRVYTSGNSGSTLTAGGSGLHADVHELRYNPLDNRLWAACDGGVYYSDNDGASFTAAYTNMSITQFYHFDVSPFNYNLMLGGAQDNGVKRRGSITSTFEDISDNDGFQVYFHPDSIRVYYSVQNKTIHRSRDSGSTWPNISPMVPDEFFPNLIRHPGNGQILITSIADTLWRSTNGGTTWTVYPRIRGKQAMCFGTSNTNRVYIAGRSNANLPATVRRSDNGGVTWPSSLILSGNPGFPVTTQPVTCIAVNPSDSRDVWVTFGGFTDGVKVFYSNDTGSSWVNRSGSLPNVPVNCIAADASNNVYVGTDNGVYYRGTGMTNWVPFYNNLPYVPVTDLIISEAEGRIRASTFGRGIWNSDVYSTCTDSIHITGTLEGQEFYEASNSITSVALLKVSEGTKVQMRGGREVRLLPGFTASDSTKFRALIGPCGGDGIVSAFRTTATPNENFPEQPVKLPVKRLTAQNDAIIPENK